VSDQGQTYASFIEAELQREHERQDHLVASGRGVVTTSGALLTLVFALSVLVTGEDFTVKGASAVAVAISLACFVVAAVLGILVNWSMAYKITKGRTLQAMLGGHWKDTEVTARNACASAQVQTIISLRNVNKVKSWLVTSALSFQVAAIAALGVAIGRELLRYM
jgi:hypothetical protein